jgi:hypothetical protein
MTIDSVRPGSTRCPHCGGLRVVVLPSRPE